MLSVSPCDPSLGDSSCPKWAVAARMPPPRTLPRSASVLARSHGCGGSRGGIDIVHGRTHARRTALPGTPIRAGHAADHGLSRRHDRPGAGAGRRRLLSDADAAGLSDQPHGPARSQQQLQPPVDASTSRSSATKTTRWSSSKAPSRDKVVPVLEELSAALAREDRLFHAVLHEVDLGKIRSKGLHYLSPDELRGIEQFLDEVQPDPGRRLVAAERGQHGRRHGRSNWKPRPARLRRRRRGCATSWTGWPRACTSRWASGGAINRPGPKCPPRSPRSAS